MSLRPHPVGLVPETTARVAHAAFPHGNVDLVCPARLSHTSSSRSGGKSARGSRPSQVAHRARGGRSASGVVKGGNAASTAVSSACSQGYSTALAALITPFARTSPVAG